MCVDDEDGENCGKCNVIDIRELSNVDPITRNVTSLSLVNCNLSALPDVIGSLPLKLLDASRNKLKYVPTAIIESLHQLENLNLSHNYLQYFEPEPKCITTLEVLNLSENNFTEIPNWIISLRCVNLKELYYSYNRIGATTTHVYLNVPLTKLHTLELINTDILWDNILFLCSLPYLKKLNISNVREKWMNCIHSSEQLLQHPKWMYHIEVLHLNRLVISTLCSNIWQMKCLREIYLHRNELYTLPEQITRLTHLEVLDVSSNHLLKFPNTFKNLVKLRVLRAHDNLLVDLPDISSMDRLRVVDLYDNKLQEFVFPICNFDMLDLESNCFDTTSFIGRTEPHHSYQNKLKLLREFYQLERFSGMCPNENEMLQIRDVSIKSLGDTDEFSEHSAVPNVGVDLEDECWDEPQLPANLNTCPLDENYGEVSRATNSFIDEPNWEDLEFIFADAD